MDDDLFACRLCSSTTDLVDVASEKTQFAAEYRNIVKIMTGIRIYPNDTLLSLICRVCLKRAIENYDYRRSAIQRDIELKRKRKQLESQIRQRREGLNQAEPSATAISSMTGDDGAVDDEEVELIAIHHDITHTSDSPVMQLATCKEEGTTPMPCTPAKQGPAPKPQAPHDTANVNQNCLRTVNNNSQNEKICTSNDSNRRRRTTAEFEQTNSRPTASEKRPAAVAACERIAICEVDVMFGNDSSDSKGGSDSGKTEINDNSHPSEGGMTAGLRKAQDPKEIQNKRHEPDKPPTVTVETDKTNNHAKTECEIKETAGKRDESPKPTRVSASVRRIMTEYPNVKLSHSAMDCVFPSLSVRVSRSAVKSHIIKLGRRLRRRGRSMKQMANAGSETNLRMDIPDVMPVTSKELKELVTSSLGLIRIAQSPTKTPTPHQPEVFDEVPVSSFTFPPSTPKKSILHPAQHTPKKSDLPATSTPAKNQHFPTAVDLIQSLHRTPLTNFGSIPPWASNSRLASPIDTEINDLAAKEEQKEEEEECSDNDNTQPDYSLIKVANEEIIFICDQCHMVFESKVAFQRHYKVHLRCALCDKTFANKYSLRRHVHGACKKVTQVNVRLLRMETDRCVRHLLPQSFFDKIGVATSRDPAVTRDKPPELKETPDESKIAEPVDDNVENVTCEVPTPSEVKAIEGQVEPQAAEEVPVSPGLPSGQNTSVEEIAKRMQILSEHDYCTDSSSSSDSMRLHIQEAIDKEASVSSLDETALKETEDPMRCLGDMQAEEADYVLKLLRTPKNNPHARTSDVREQVTYKDFIGVVNSDQTLWIQNLGRVLKMNEIVPVVLKYRPKRVKVRIADYAPPIKQEKFFDFSRSPAISLDSCRRMPSKRTVYSFSTPLAALNPASSQPPSGAPLPASISAKRKRITVIASQSNEHTKRKRSKNAAEKKVWPR